MQEQEEFIKRLREREQQWLQEVKTIEDSVNNDSSDEQKEALTKQVNEESNLLKNKQDKQDSEQPEHFDKLAKLHSIVISSNDAVMHDRVWCLKLHGISEMEGRGGNISNQNSVYLFLLKNCAISAKGFSKATQLLKRVPSKDK